MVFDGARHNADFSSQKCSEDDGKDECRGQNVGRSEAAESGIDGEQTLNGPRLTAYFCHNPATLSGKIDAGQGEESTIVKETRTFEALLIV